jgi:23S rRNA pseudouridine1911/1915/1917 synthase
MMEMTMAVQDEGIIHLFTAFSQDAGTRLDIFLAANVPDLSRSQVKKAVDEGWVLVNDLPARASSRLREGDVIRLEIRKPTVDQALPEDIPLSIVFEDSHLLVIDKPAGLVVHPAAGNRQGTLVNALLYHCNDLSGIGGVLRPGIVHRLDKQTSGLLVVAKSDAVHRALAMQFKEHQVRKVYRALVYGNPKEEEGTINMPVGRHPSDRKKMSTSSRWGKEALTRWHIRERYGVVALLDVELLTGRTHQIRVHLRAAGYPVVGDPVYGIPQRVNAVHNTLVRSQLKAMHRQALHASEIGFIHPISRKSLSFLSPLPADMTALCDYLRQSSKNSF